MDRPNGNNSDTLLVDLRSKLFSAETHQELVTCLGDIRQQTRQVSSQLDSVVLSGQATQDHCSKRIELLKTQLSTALKASRDLTSMLSSASFISSRISQKVSSIDAEHARIKQALQYVRDVIDLKSNVIGVQDAMDMRDWERAAHCISKANSLPHSLVDGQFARAMVPTTELPDCPAETLEKASQTLGQLFLREFSKATQVKDMENVTRYFKLFPLIGQESQGLEVYAKFICGIIITHSRTLMQDAHRTGADSAMFYGLAMSRLFENIATIVSQHSPIVEKHYGRGKMRPVIDKIQNEADSQGGLIIDTFWDERRIAKLVSDIKGYAFSYLVSSFTAVSSRMPASSGGSRSGSPALEGHRHSEDEGVDLKTTANLVNEMAMILNRWSLYKRFLALQWDEDAAKLPTLHTPPVIAESALTRKIEKEISPAIESMATFVFRRSVEKAFQLDELPDLTTNYSEENPLISSVVDDIMYMLSTLCKQILSSGDAAVIKTIFTNFRRILESDFVGIMQRKLRDEAPKLSQVLRAPTPTHRKSEKNQPEDTKLRIFLIYLNNLALAACYAEKIFAEFTIRENLPFGDDAQSIQTVVSTMSASFKSRCNEIVSDGLQVVFSTVANSRLRALTSQVLRDAEYMASPNELNEVNVSGIFSYGWHKLMNDYLKVLCPDNYNRLITVVAGSLSRILEKWVWSLEGKVNELGAIALDRDISRIIAVVSEGHYKLREKFVRVAQIVMIVGFEGVQDEEGIEWSLSEDERYRARKIRVDRR